MVDGYHDEWDLFLAWPIDDPYLESVRQRCIRVCDEDGPEPVEARLRQELEEILQELRPLMQRRDVRAELP